MMSWGMIMFHVVIVSLLSNIGKLCPMFFYRDRKLSERLALSIGMFTRGEVGAGIIFIALGYNLGGPALVISVLTLVLNLILTGIFVLWVKTGVERGPIIGNHVELTTGCKVIGLSSSTIRKLPVLLRYELAVTALPTSKQLHKW
jgi:Kef-type K+ transport system membrane component KefB